MDDPISLIRSEISELAQRYQEMKSPGVTSLSHIPTKESSLEHYVMVEKAGKMDMLRQQHLLKRNRHMTNTWRKNRAAMQRTRYEIGGAVVPIHGNVINLNQIHHNISAT